jgi:hypothetical protein
MPVPSYKFHDTVCSALCSIRDEVINTLKADFDNDRFTPLDYHFLRHRISSSITGNAAVAIAKRSKKKYKTKKGDISNEVRKGTFLKSFDMTPRIR